MAYQVIVELMKGDQWERKTMDVVGKSEAGVCWEIFSLYTQTFPELLAGVKQIMVHCGGVNFLEEL